MGCDAVVSDDERVLRTAERLVLPGVGAFASCMKSLRERGFDSVVQERAATGTPLLGICVGMQMLFEMSDEFGTTERSEEHTSELQSLAYLVCRLLLEKKKQRMHASS